MEAAVEESPQKQQEVPLVKEKEVEKQPKRSKEERANRKKDEKSHENVMKWLSSFNSTEDKLAAMCKKYSEVADENKRNQLAFKASEKRALILQKEKEQIHGEHSKAVCTRSKLESLCRELQRQNKSMKEESLQRIREEEETRREVSAKFQATLADITVLMQQNSDSNLKLRNENLDMQERFKSVCEQHQLRESQVDKISKQMQLESQLADARIRKAQLEMQAQNEILERDKQQVMAQLAMCQANLIEKNKTETSLRAQLNVYFQKYDEFQDVLTKSNKVYTGFKGDMDKMSKKITRLEKETSSWKQKWETSQQALLTLSHEKKLKDAEVQLQARQLLQLQKLCRTLQTERGSLLQQLKNEGITPETSDKDAKEASELLEKTDVALAPETKETESDSNDADVGPSPSSSVKSETANPNKNLISTIKASENHEIITSETKPLPNDNTVKASAQNKKSPPVHSNRNETKIVATSPENTESPSAPCGANAPAEPIALIESPTTLKNAKVLKDGKSDILVPKKAQYSPSEKELQPILVSTPDLKDVNSLTSVQIPQSESKSSSPKQSDQAVLLAPPTAKKVEKVVPIVTSEVPSPVAPPNEILAEKTDPESQGSTISTAATDRLVADLPVPKAVVVDSPPVLSKVLLADKPSPAKTLVTDTPSSTKISVLATPPPLKTLAVNTLPPEKTLASDTTSPAKASEVDATPSPKTSVKNTPSPTKAMASDTISSAKAPAADATPPPKTSVKNTPSPAKAMAVDTTTPTKIVVSDTISPEKTVSPSTSSLDKAVAPDTTSQEQTLVPDTASPEKTVVSGTTPSPTKPIDTPDTISPEKAAAPGTTSVEKTVAPDITSPAKTTVTTNPASLVVDTLAPIVPDTQTNRKLPSVASPVLVAESSPVASVNGQEAPKNMNPSSDPTAQKKAVPTKNETTPQANTLQTASTVPDVKAPPTPIIHDVKNPPSEANVSQGETSATVGQEKKANQSTPPVAEPRKNKDGRRKKK